MSSHNMRNPNGGVNMGHVIEPPDPDLLCETPRADPHAGCCGGWGRKTPGYPISQCFPVLIL